MEQTAERQREEASDEADRLALRNVWSKNVLAQQGVSGTCSCGSATPSNPPTYVYALGNIETRFPRPSVEKEFAQATGRADTKGKTDREVFHTVLAKPENRYLARQLCWLFTVQGLETYLLQPRDPGDFTQLIEAIRPSPTPLDIDIVIGMRGPIAPPELCNGLMVPIVVFDQLYSFDRTTLISSIPRPENIAAKEFSSAAEELFDRIRQMTDNAGATDEHRALNYLAMRYSAIYAQTTECYGRNYALTAVDIRLSPLSGLRKIVEVVFTFTHRQSDVTDKFFVRVDVTDEFPYLVSKLSPYFDR